MPDKIETVVSNSHMVVVDYPSPATVDALLDTLCDAQRATLAARADAARLQRLLDAALARIRVLERRAAAAPRSPAGEA